MLLDGQGKEELVVVAAVHGGRHHVHVDFLGHGKGLGRNGNLFKIDLGAQARVACQPDDGLAQAAGEEIAAGGQRIRLDEAGHDARLDLRTQVAGQDGLVFRQVGLLASAGERDFLALEHVQAHVGCAHVTAEADQVHVFRGRHLLDDALLLHAAGCQPDGQAVDGRIEFERQLTDTVFAASGQHSFPKLGHVFVAEAFGESQHHRQRHGLAQAGVQFSEHIEHGLVAQVFQRRVDQVEIAALQHELLSTATLSFLPEQDGLFVRISALLKELFKDGLLADFSYLGSCHRCKGIEGYFTGISRVGTTTSPASL